MKGYEALRSSVAQLDLSGRGKIRVTGDDRARLLHAMSSNDIQRLAPSHGLYAFFLTAQGRILADANIFHLNGALWLDTEPEIANKLRDHLDKYIIADDVELQDETRDWLAVGIEGPQSIAFAESLHLPVPGKDLSVQNFHSGFIARVAGTGPAGIRIFLPRTENHLLPSFEIPSATPAEARLVRLENGVPRYGEDISERYLTHETQQLRAVHANKGCYLGQEIVERVRSRGQVHRLLTSVRIVSDQVPPSGTRLLVDGKDSGELTSAAYSPALGQTVAFAYLRSEALQNKASFVVAGTDPPVAATIA